MNNRERFIHSIRMEQQLLAWACVQWLFPLVSFIVFSWESFPGDTLDKQNSVIQTHTTEKRKIKSKHNTHTTYSYRRYNNKWTQTKIIMYKEYFEFISSKQKLSTSHTPSMQADKKINGHLTHFIVQYLDLCTILMIVRNYCMYHTIHGTLAPKIVHKWWKCHMKACHNLYIGCMLCILNSIGFVFMWEIGALDSTERQQNGEWDIFTCSGF